MIKCSSYTDQSWLPIQYFNSILGGNVILPASVVFGYKRRKMMCVVTVTLQAGLEWNYDSYHPNKQFLFLPVAVSCTPLWQLIDEIITFVACVKPNITMHYLFLAMTYSYIFVTLFKSISAFLQCYITKTFCFKPRCQLWVAHVLTQWNLSLYSDHS